ncbi:hypothetical protein [Bacillus anthracis]|uniref:hypothetical protein n=1 Tax=Bacillus anthracis TaxID=1392 RepID=UPI00099CEE4E|nr:hypothetical protein [Bacillus anthracis]OPD59736.1 hypothetical protein BVG01_06890 [Bacillus anthracis]
MHYDKDRYYKIVKEVVNVPTIYVEGECNKIFYQQLIELEGMLIENGGSCIDIKQKILREENSFGIVDHDYEENFDEKLFPIDFYSLENVSLIHIKELEALKVSINEYLNRYNIERARVHKCKFVIIRNEEKRPINFNIELLDKKHHNQFERYINSRIISEDNFLQYKDIKLLVENYIRFYREYSGVQLNYLTDLTNSLKYASVTEIFDEITLRKFKASFA